MINEKYEVPQDTLGDVSHTSAKVALSLVPFAGLAEVFNMIVTPPLEKRKAQWMQLIAEAVTELESKHANISEMLSNNDEFISLLMQASQAAVKTHLKEKQLSLRKTLLRFAEAKVEFDVASAYLAATERLQPMHIKLLPLLEKIESVSQFESKKLFYSHLQVSLDEDVEQAFLEAFLNELSQAGLVTNEHRTTASPGAMLGEPYYHFMLSSFGRKYLDFVKKDS
jgi:hypothetical protein